jgi:TRAP-type C4-dicarboxylate transport system permease small subunit
MLNGGRRMTHVASLIYQGLLKVIKLLIVILGIALVLVVFSNVVARYFLNFSLAWAEETARFLFIWLSFLGAVLANAYSEHMNFDLLVNRSPKKLGQLLQIIAYLIILSVLFLVIQGGITIVIGNWEWLTPALEISYGLVYSIVPVCCVLLALQFLVRLFRIIQSLLGLSAENRG